MNLFMSFAVFFTVPNRVVLIESVSDFKIVEQGLIIILPLRNIYHT